MSDSGICADNHIILFVLVLFLQYSLYFRSMKTLKINAWTGILVQVVLWLLILCIPLVSLILNGSTWQDALGSMKYYFAGYIPWLLVFYINYFCLIPRYIFRRKTWSFFFANLLLIPLLQLASRFYMMQLHVDMPPMGAGAQVAITLGGAVLNMFLILAAIALKVQQRNAQLELDAATLEREKMASELEHLKNQLNPHFLFNTLNNISSLVSLDPDAAQTSISRLSDMLRYVLYDSAKPTVPLKTEIKFLYDYVDLMRLRYADTLHVEMMIDDPDMEGEIPPLLYITFVENAFKHGASSRHECYINVFLMEDNDLLNFSVANSFLEPDEKPAGQTGGVGLKNLERRLQLLYKSDDYIFRLSKDGYMDIEGNKEMKIPCYEAILDIQMDKIKPQRP
ncbi:MAG: hypothetical protein BACD_03836 [Bacteroides rodentium]